jgi:hypothetical protein
MQISEAVQQFIIKYIHAVDQLEILLLLHNEPSREWTAHETARSLFTQPESAESRMVELVAQGLLSQKKSGDETRYQYGPRTRALDVTVAELAQQYPKYRVSIINLIFSKPIDKIRTFADAFRFTREDKEEEK